MGGESSKNVELFRRLRDKGVDVWLLCHERCKSELESIFQKQDSFSRIVFVEDTWTQRILFRVGKLLPYSVQDLIIGALIHVVTQKGQRKLAREMIDSENINLVFQPSPLAAKSISMMYGLGVPVVIGPLTGGLDFPPSFGFMEPWAARVSIRIARRASSLLHWLFPGKPLADTLIYSDQAALNALPANCRGKTIQMLEPAVDTDLWCPRERANERVNPQGPTRFVFVGRLVDWKGVQYLIEAFERVANSTDAVLEIVGDGVLAQELQATVDERGLRGRIRFHGWRAYRECVELLRDCDVFVMPSLRESGGHAILEAMAVGLPVIATKWGGPAATVSADCGILVKPDSRESFIEGLSNAMLRLARSPELRTSMGQQAPIQLSRLGLDWDAKCERFIDIFHQTLHSWEQSHAAAFDRASELSDNTDMGRRRTA
jgi:hypothetical protein